MRKVICILLAFLLIASLTPVMYANLSAPLLDMNAIDQLRQANPDYNIQVSPDGAISFELIVGIENYFSFPAEVLLSTDWSDYYCLRWEISGLQESIDVIVFNTRDVVTLDNAEINIDTGVYSKLLPENKQPVQDILEFGFVFSQTQAVHTVTISDLRLDIDRTVSPYTHQTVFTLTPSGIQIIDSVTDLQALSDEIRPAIAVLYADADYSLQEALAFCSERVLPAFYVTDDTINYVLEFIVENESTDAFIISDSAELLIKAYNTLPSVGRILHITEDMPAAQIHKAVNTAMARMVLLENDTADKSTIRHLSARFDTVWVMADSNSTTELYRAVTSGAAGIVTDDVSVLYAVYDTFTAENSITNPGFIIGHRGIPSLAPENTIEGALLATEKGATHIELDIYITIDGHVIVSHDSTTERCGDINLSVEQSTLQQLKQVTLEQGLKIPTLEEFLTALKPTGAIAVIEIKSSKTAVIDESIRLIQQLDMADQCVFISFNKNQLTYLNKTYPEYASCAYLRSTPGGRGTYARHSKTLAQDLRKNGHTADLSAAGITHELMQEFLHRGITTWGWTINGAAYLRDFYMNGMMGITTDEAHTFSTFIKDITAPENTLYIIKEGQLPKLDKTVTLETYDGTTSRQQAQMLVANAGTANLQLNSETYTAVPGTAEVCFYAGTDCTLYTQPVTLIFRLYGDLTADNNTSLADVITLAKLVISDTQPDTHTKKLADINSDNSVSLADVMELALYIL